jgi:hypothetical protein
MKTLSFAVLVIAVAAGSALAQPGVSPPDPYPAPPPQPYPQPPPGGYQVPPPYAYQPQPVQLTADENELLQQGEISDGQHLGGGVAALFFGFGIGQAVQGRWSDTGWIFTLGEGASMVAFVAGFVKVFEACDLDGPGTCSSNEGAGLLWAGLLGYLVFHTWEVVDAFVGPPRHNTKVRALKMRLGIPVMYGKRVVPYLNQSHDGGAVGGITIRF